MAASACVVPLPDAPNCSRIVPTGPSDWVLAVGCKKSAFILTKDTMNANSDGMVELTNTGTSGTITAIAPDRHGTRCAAGSDQGTARVWDVKTGEAIRTFSGCHRAAVTTIEMHPFAEFICTASNDSITRIWDLRKKSCVQVYKDQSKDGTSRTCPVTCTRFAPDGRQVVAGYEDGRVRLLDLVAGKPLHEISREHRSPITSLCYHPTRCLLISSSSEGVLCVSDVLSAKTAFSATAPGAAFAAANESDVFWVGSGQGYVVSCSSYEVRELDRHVTSWSSVSNLTLTATGNAVVSELDTNHVSVKTHSLVIKPKVLANAGASPQPQVKHASHKPYSLPEGRSEQPPQHDVHLPGPAAPQPKQRPIPPPAAEVVTSPTQALQPPPPMQHQRVAPQIQQAPPAVHQEVRQPRSAPRTGPPKGGEAFDILAKDPPPAKRRASPPSTHQLLQQQQQQQNEGMDEELLLDDCLGKSDNMITFMQRRTTHLRVARTLWQQDPSKCVQHLHQISKESNDLGAVLDFIQSLQNQRMRERVSIELLPPVLSLINNILQDHPVESYLLTCMKTVRQLNVKFRPKVEEGLRAAAVRGPGVDLNLESRVERARAASVKLDEVQRVIAQYLAREDAVGEEARLLHRELPPAR